MAYEAKPNRPANGVIAVAHALVESGDDALCGEIVIPSQVS